MRAARSALFVVLLLGADFSCPLLPGAVVFEIGQSVEGRPNRPRQVDQTASGRMPAAPMNRVNPDRGDGSVLPSRESPARRDTHRQRSSTFASTTPSTSSVVEDH
jgi:hypothetical protein